jgi:YcxB-like protein
MMGPLKWHRFAAGVSGGTAMEVEFVLRPDDVMAFHDYLWAHPPKQARTLAASGLSWGLVLISGLLSLCSAYWLLQGDYSFITVYPPVLFLMALLLRLSWRSRSRWIVRRNLARKVDKNAKLLGWQRLALTPEALAASSEHSTTTLAWAAIEKIVITEKHALIFDSPTTAYVVPRRAFADEDEFREFVATARDYRDAPPEKSKPSRKPNSDADTGITRDERADR